MKKRLQKAQRLGLQRKKREVTVQPKTRKQLRKQKRQQKKVNRANFHSRKKADRHGAGEDDGHDAEKASKRKATARARGDSSDDDDDNKCDEDDEEIDSDFDDEIMEKETTGQSKSSLLEADRKNELRELKRYQNSLKDQRIAQLEAANEEDDKVIKKYEKLLNLNRRKDKSDSLKYFDDGLDYALELCTEQNIRKMYEAAKEAAEGKSEDEFADDVQEVLHGGQTNQAAGKQPPPQVDSKRERLRMEKQREKMDQLKEIERKYLDGEDSLGEYDSEMEIELASDAPDDYSENDELHDSDEDEEANAVATSKKSNSKRVRFQQDEQDESGTEEENDSLDSESEDDTESKEDLNVQIDKKATSKKDQNRNQAKKVAPKAKGSSKKNQISESEEFSDSDAQDEDEPLPKKKAKMKASKNAEQQKSKKQKCKQIEESSLDEDDEENLGSEDDGLDDLLDGIGSESDSEEADEVDEEKEAEEEKEDARKTKGKEKGIWEDIYGRKRDKDGNVIREEATSTGKYVPPHLRARTDAKSQEKLLRLKRQLKGQINRLAESNVHRIAIDLDNLYMQNARYDMNSTLTALIMEALVTHSLAQERMVLEHVLLLTILHANVGSEVGSHFMETVAERLCTMVEQIKSYETEDKTLDNYVLIMCHMYTFEIFKSKLIYEIVDKLLEKFNEKAVECILLVLKSVGFVLRKDDPIALKEMVLKIQKKAADAPPELKNDSRIKFMLDTLLAVKNNNMTKIPQYDPGLVEHFRKILKGMITKGKYVSTFNIGLDDLQNAEERGKWWLVGSAWHGNNDGGAKANGSTAPSGTNTMFSQHLLDMARQQRMNTDDRRNIFCVLMSAEDYLDCFDKIIRLSIKDQRAIATVIVHCCLAEKDHNPYYAVLSQKFCDFDRRYQLAIQYATWDRLKEIQALKPNQVRNLAKYLMHLIAEGGLAISCLKVVEFVDIDKVTLRLMRQLMLGLLLLEDEGKCVQVFNRIAGSFKLKSFKDSLRLFLHHFIARGGEHSNSLTEEQATLLRERIKKVDGMLIMSDTTF